MTKNDTLFAKLNGYPRFIPRDVSWLFFNHRVLQEASKDQVPILERLRFMAIYESNLQEFFRVRVASLRKLRSLGKENRVQLKLDIKPNRQLRIIKHLIGIQRELFDQILFEQLIPKLKENHVHILSRGEAEHQFHVEVIHFFDQNLSAFLKESHLQEMRMRENQIYYLGRRDEEVMAFYLDGHFDRFIQLKGGQWVVLDEIVRIGMMYMGFHEFCTVQVDRDAELVLKDGYAYDIIEQIKHALDERSKGNVIRVLYSRETKSDVLDQLETSMKLSRFELYPGSIYLKMTDLFSFISLLEKPAFLYPPKEAIGHPILKEDGGIQGRIRRSDTLVHFPYQEFTHLENLLTEVIEDGDLKEIRIVIYRTGDTSRVGELLIRSLQKGIAVKAYIEIKARFDEKANIAWVEKLREAGAEILTPKKSFKIHSKLLQLVFDQKDNIAFISTGNFNHKTAKIYADHGLLTSDVAINSDVSKVFECIANPSLETIKTEKLLVSPFSMREGLKSRLRFEAEEAKQGREAYAVLKMNNLEDPELIDELYAASLAGVKIILLVRGICCLNIHFEEAINITAYAIIDRYLEHARLFLFCNGEKEVLYLASSDWMTRNMDRRIEVACPIEDEKCFTQLRALLNLQTKDNTQSRVIDHDDNQWVMNDHPAIRSQEDFRDFLHYHFKN